MPDNTESDSPKESTAEAYEQPATLQMFQDMFYECDFRNDFTMINLNL